MHKDLEFRVWEMMRRGLGWEVRENEGSDGALPWDYARASGWDR